MYCLNAKSDFCPIFTAEESPSSIRKLKYGLNKGDGIKEKLEAFTNLQYINIRMCHISTAEVGLLGRLLGNTDSPLTTVILDGLKLSGTPAIKDLLGNLLSLNLSCIARKPVFGVSDQVNTKEAVLPQLMVTCLKFRI